MSRKHATKKQTVIALALPLLAPLAGLQGADQPPIKPNILHIHADDHRPDGLHALGNSLLQTPNLDTLVRDGMTFTRCYTMGSMVGAVCLPSRTMLLTGRSWLRIPGGRAAAQPWNAAMSLPRVLSAAGYQTFHVGKGGNEFKAGIEAFDQNIVMDDRGPDLRRGSSERHADAALTFLGERDTSRPFYIYLAPPVPHDPRVAAPEFMDRYAVKDIPLPAAFMPVHPFDNGEMTVRDEKLAPWPRTPEDTKQQLADYYACISGLDYHVGRIFDALRQSGAWTNTIVIFSGDNGLSLGEHGLFGKQNVYEFGGMHVPLVIAGPGIPKGKSDAFVYLMDLFPTFAEFAGGKLPEGVEGRSIVPVLVGRETKVRDTLYSTYKNCQRAIRDDRWKLIRYPDVDVTQLFDLQADPHELNNLAGDPAHAAKVKELTALLKQAMQEYGDDTPLIVEQPKPSAWTPPSSGATEQRKKKRGAIKHRFVATDESGKQLLYVDETNPANDWTVPLPGNRDIQLSGKGTVLVSVPVGYREYALKTGEMLKEINVGDGIQTLVRVDNGHTFLASKTAVIELDENDAVVGRNEIQMGGNFRLLRLARNGNLLFTSGQTTVKELQLSGSAVREIDLTRLTPESLKPYFMEETSDGRFFISTGYGATILILDKDWSLVKSYGGKGRVDGVETSFFADAQQLKNGNVVVAHWSGHGRDDSKKAPQAIEFDKAGSVVWRWHDPKRAGTLHGIEVIE